MPFHHLLGAVPRRLALITAFAVLPQAHATQPPWEVDPAVGVWLSSVEVRLCHNGQLINSFTGMQVLHHGGTLSDTNTAPPSTRGPGFGTWVREGQTLRATFRFARFTPDGQHEGWARIELASVIAPGGATATGTGRAELEAPDGTVVAAACVTATERRAR
jgi:hypothetical protein